MGPKQMGFKASDLWNCQIEIGFNSTYEELLMPRVAVNNLAKAWLPPNFNSLRLPFENQSDHVLHQLRTALSITCMPIMLYYIILYIYIISCGWPDPAHHASMIPHPTSHPAESHHQQTRFLLQHIISPDIICFNMK